MFMGLLPLSLAGTRVSWAAHCCCGAVLNRGKHGKLRISMSRQDKLFLVWGLQQTFALISSEFGYHWRSILRVCGLIQVFVWVEKRGSSNLLGVALQPRGMVRGTVLLFSPKCIKRLLVFYSLSERENRGRKSSESYIQR